MPIQELNDWMYKFAGVDMWDTKKMRPTDHVTHAYPYFYIDLMAAWENEGRRGARKVLKEYSRRVRTRSACVHYWNDCTFKVYPEGVRAIKVTKQELLPFGYYERYVEEGLFEFEGEYFRELLWHMHDGYGAEAGTVECHAWK